MMNALKIFMIAALCATLGFGGIAAGYVAKARETVDTTLSQKGRRFAAMGGISGSLTLLALLVWAVMVII
ncbi:MAG: hypothetical protein LUE86_10670 [Clostridiales bacterium]|nr:hypothetical protein [Clostridiales bacterium]